MEENEIPIDDKPLFDEASLGIQAEVFLNSPVGAHLIAQAELLLTESCGKLITLSPGDQVGIADAQVDGRVAIKIKEWLLDMVISGQVAEENLKAKVELENQM